MDALNGFVISPTTPPPTHVRFSFGVTPSNTLVFRGSGRPRRIARPFKTLYDLPRAPGMYLSDERQRQRQGGPRDEESSAGRYETVVILKTIIRGGERRTVLLSQGRTVTAISIASQ
jgi:hypothetical protein